MANRGIAYLVVYLYGSLLAGCGALPEQETVRLETFPAYGTTDTTHVVKEKLYIQFDEWRGVRYKLGGLSRHGIDCSGFVYVTFKSQLGLHLPRTTHLQSQIGREIRRSELETGDLVFFKTGFTSRHVGIYLEENKFLHVSLRKGVTISELDNVYWKPRYWKAIRV